MTYLRTVAPDETPVDVALLKEHLRLSSSDQANVLPLYLDAAVAWVETYTGRPLMRQTWRVTLPAFPDRTWLPYAAPFVAISSVAYYDTANASQTLASSVYAVAEDAEPACLRLAYGQVWPSVYDRDDAVTITYTVGAAAAADVPVALRQAVLLLAGHFYENREAVLMSAISKEIESTATALCAPYRLFLRAPEC